MATIRIKKTSTVPTVLEPNVLYLIKESGNILRICLTDKDGAVLYKSCGSVEASGLITAYIESIKNQPDGLAGIDLNGNVIGNITAIVNALDGQNVSLSSNGVDIWDSFTEQLVYRNLTGGNNPTWGTLFANQQGLLFSGSNMNQTWAEVCLKTDVKVGSRLRFSFPVTVLGSDSGTANFGIEYHISKGYNQDSFPSTGTTISMPVTIAANSQRRVHTVTSPIITNSDIEPGALIHMRLYRRGDTDTVIDNLHVSIINIHYEKARLGTINPVYPFTS